MRSFVQFFLSFSIFHFHHVKFSHLKLKFTEHIVPPIFAFNNALCSVPYYAYRCILVSVLELFYWRQKVLFAVSSDDMRFSFAELEYDIELEALLVILSEKQRQKGGEDEIKNKTLAGRMIRKPYIFLSLHHTCIH